VSLDWCSFSFQFAVHLYDERWRNKRTKASESAATLRLFGSLIFAIHPPNMRLKNSLTFLSASVFTIAVGSATLPSVFADDALTTGHEKVRGAIAAQNSVTPKLMRTPGILGTAVGLNDAGDVSVVIYVDQNHPQAGGLGSALSGKVSGFPVHVEFTDQFHAYGKPGASGGGPRGVSHTATQTPPIQLGTSGGWGYDLANGYCCGGTLGSLIAVNDGTTTVQYILSNYHVFESDIVLGGNNIIATDGTPVIQPGLIDVGCTLSSAQSVASLKTVQSLPNYNVDVGIAQANSGMVRADGSILEIGTISAQTAAAAIGKNVKKSGRTTGLSRSSIAQLNATISVVYDNECAGGTAFTKTYTGQIVIQNQRSKFLNSGDSGSLMVEDVAVNPRAVGLLYAGSSTSAIANPIDEVLTFVGSQLHGTATMVGQ
jgi:hypothetical protein